MYSWMIGTVAAGFAVGWLPVLPSLSVTLLCAGLALIVAVLPRGRWSRLSLIVSGALTGLVLGTLWGQQLLHQRLPVALEGEVLELEVRILEPPQRRTYQGSRVRQRFAAQLQTSVCTGDGQHCLQAGSRVLLAYYSDGKLSAGELWRLQARLKRPWGLANPGSFNYQSWLAQHRFAATGSVRSDSLQRIAAPTLWPNPHQLARQRVLEAIGRLPLDPRVAAMLGAIAVGQRGAIGYADWQLLQQLGLNHLVVVSGLHVGMMAGVGYWFGLQLGRCLVLTGYLRSAGSAAHCCALVVAIAYSALAGFALPTTRALIMLALVQVGLLLKRRVQWRYTLAWALFFIMLMEPLATHNAGFWLSFGAVLAIATFLALRPDLQGWRQLLYLQLCLSLATGLLSSLWFGGSSMAAPLANIVAIPVVGMMIAPLGLLGVALLPFVESLAAACWRLAALPLQGLLQFGDWLQSNGLQPWLSYQPGWPSLLLALLAIILLLLPPALRWRYLALPLLLPLLLPDRPPPPVDTLQVTALDVGQGLAVVLRTAEHTVLYDTGAGDPAGPNMATSVILPYLRQQGVDSLDLMIISHADNDHASGLQSVRDALPVDQIWFGDVPAAAPLMSSDCRAGRALQLGHLRLTQVHPPGGEPLRTRNNRSCVVLLEYYGYRVLLPGDIEKSVELGLLRKKELPLDIDLLLAPHHGSLTSSSVPFVNTLAPTEVVFTSGYRNRFSHPRPEVVQRYRRVGSRLWYTAEQGAVQFTIRRGELQRAGGWREQRRYYWY